MKRYIYIFSLILIASVNYSIGQVAVISEYYNMSGTPEGEWTEILITADNAKLVGYTLRDNSESGDWQGGIKFKNISLWQNLRKGTIIVIWHRQTGASKDINPADGYLEVNAEDAELFEKRLFSAPTWGVAVMNLSQNIDIIQLLDESDNNVHSLGHSNAGETSVMSSITNSRIFHNGGISGDGFGVRVVPGRNIDEYNKGWDASNSYTEASDNVSKGLPNSNSTYPDANRMYWQSLRQPKWSSYNSGVAITMLGDKAQIEWTPANYNMDPVEGYMILRVPSDDIATTPAPLDGKIYKAGDRIGSAEVVGVIYQLNQYQFIDDDLRNAECGRSYVYRIYAFRFGKDDADMDNIPENVRGRIYNTSQFAQTDTIYKSQPPKPIIKSKDGRTEFCETEDVFIDLIGEYTTDLTFQWYRNGVPHVGETGTRLEVNEDGLYQIIAKNINTLCETASDIVRITILPMPVAALYIKQNGNLIPVINDTIIYVCKDDSRLYPYLIIEGADSIEWYFNDRLKTEEIDKFETIADQRGTYYGVVLNGICRDSTPKLTILYYDLHFEFNKTDILFKANSKMKDTVLITNKSNANILISVNDFVLPSGIFISNISFPFIFYKDSTIELEFTFETVETGYFYRVEKIFLNTVCSRSYDINATMMNPQPQSVIIIPMPDTLDYGVFPVCDFEANNKQLLILQAIGNLQAKVLSIEYPDSYIQASTSAPFVIDSNSSASIDFEILYPFPKTLSGTIRIIYESIESDPRRDTVIVYYKGEIVLPDLIFDDKLNFSIPTCSDTTYLTIEMTNPTNLNLRINAQPGNPQLFLEDLPIIFQPKETKLVRFRLISNSSITFNDKIIIQPCAIEKQISIMGEKSDISVIADTNNIDFGYVAICDDTSNIRKLLLEIQNGEVAINNIEITGDFEINASVGDVFFGDTLLEIIYIGKNAGVSSGKLKLTFSPCDKIVEIDLSAIGVLPEISITPENIMDFGDVVLSTISSKSITIKNITNLTIKVDVEINDDKFTIGQNVELPIILPGNGESEIAFNYFNTISERFDSVVIYFHIQPCDIVVPYILTAHSIENNVAGLIKIDLPEQIIGEPGDWVEIPVRILPNKFSFGDVDFRSLKIDFEYNGKILYCKEITGLNSAIDGDALIYAAEENANTFRILIDSIPNPNPVGDEWLDFSIIAQILQGDTLRDIFKVKDAIFKASVDINVEGDSSLIIVEGDCLIENRVVQIGMPSQAEITMTKDNTIHSKIHLAVDSDLLFEVYNIDGILMKRNEYKSLKYGSYQLYVNLSEINDGVYFIKISSLDFVKIEKIILIK